MSSVSLEPPALTTLVILSVASLMTLATVTAIAVILAAKLSVVPVTVLATSLALFVRTVISNAALPKSITPVEPAELTEFTSDFKMASPALAAVTLSPPAPLSVSLAVTKKLAILAAFAINAVA